MYGKGLNSIRVRFTLMIGVLVATTAVSLFAFDRLLHLDNFGVWSLGFLALASAIIPAAITFLMAGKLTNLIVQLRHSAEAIAAGDFNSPVNVNCACEIGGLADSFRAMVARLNSNILRMNVLAYSDRVTQLPNRTVITHVLNRCLANPAGAPFQAAVMFIDLDKFKQVNDSLGHDAGDELLRQASMRILAEGFHRTPETIDNCMTAFGELCDRPPKDIVFVRFAGDEFVALMPGMTDRHELEAVAGRVIACLLRPFRIANTDVTIGASIGIACTPLDTREAADLLNYADLAMYAAKEAGRNRCVFFDGTLREAALQRVNIEKDLREAVANRELVLHFQPKIHAETQDVRGVEVLVRWQHPVRGLLMPNDFIGIAEKSGLIESVGCHVAELAMKQAAAWQRAGRNLPVSINVSGLQFMRPEFVDKMTAMLEKVGAPPGAIELELTESVALSDIGYTMHNLERLRAAGVKVAIDDFGCGFSNLSQLSQLTFDTLKIDRSLVESIGVDGKAESVIKAIISMGHSLGHEIVVEGVETMRQLAFLRQHRCDMVQGFLIARAMPAAALESWLDDRQISPAILQQEEVGRKLLSA